LQSTLPETVVVAFDARAAHDPLPTLQAYRGLRGCFFLGMQGRPKLSFRGRRLDLESHLVQLT
jgi:hypothetical protein